MAKVKEQVDEQEIMNRDETGKFLSTNRKTVDYLVSTNQIPYSRIGKRLIRFKRSRLLAWLDEREGVEYRLPRKTE